MSRRLAFGVPVAEIGDLVRITSLGPAWRMRLGKIRCKTTGRSGYHVEFRRPDGTEMLMVFTRGEFEILNPYRGAE